MEAASARDPKRSGSRDFGAAWLAATGVFAAAGAALAAIAWGRAQYPLLAPSEAVALALRWSIEAVGASAPFGVGIAAGVRLGGPWRRPALAASLAAVAVLVVLLVLRGAEPAGDRAIAPPPAPPAVATVDAARAPNLVLVTIDTLRADHLDAYGYARPTAPALARLAADGVLFERAISPAPATQLAVASILTGLLPWSHADPGRARPAGAPYLRSGFATLAERLAAAGWDTGAFVANPAVRASEGYAQGFARFDETAAASGRVEPVLAPALAWLATARAPFFLWLHVMDPHHPYDAPELAPWEDPRDARAAALRGEWSSLPYAQQTARLLAVGDEGGLDEATRRLLVDRYDAEIRHADAGVGRLLAALEARGATRANTWIVATSDHGEELLDHGRLLHGHTLYDELLHVPLIVRAPAAPAGLRVAASVSTIDVAATLLTAAGQTSADLDARSLAPFWESPARAPARLALASREGKYLALASGGWKLVMAQSPPPPEAPPAHGVAALRFMGRVAFDREHRPKVGYWASAEEPLAPRVVARAHRDARRLHAALTALRSEAPPRAVAEDDPVATDAAVVEQLRALGYAQ